MDDFVNAICKEAALQKNFLGDEEIQTIYFGGGTPSILDNMQIEKILTSLYKYFKIGKNCEITFETNPDDMALNYLMSLKNLGINRLSVGIQSFEDSLLKLMKRKHAANQALSAIKDSQKIGFRNISVDLIYDLPGLTLKTWESDINKILNLKIQHISAYHLTIEPKTIFYKLLNNQKLKLPTEDESLNQFELLTEKLEENGYLHYEISNFAKDGFISLHNTNYWMNVKYLGLGPSAHSYNLTSRQWNIRNLQGYLSSILQGKIPFEKEKLTKKEKYNDYVITSLRTMWGINISKLKNGFGNSYLNYFLNKTKKYIKQNLMINKKQNFVLTKKGKIISDNIIEDFLYI